jgi:hypothetical protein
LPFESRAAHQFEIDTGDVPLLGIQPSGQRGARMSGTQLGAQAFVTVQ